VPAPVDRLKLVPKSTVAQISYTTPSDTIASDYS